MKCQRCEVAPRTFGGKRYCLECRVIVEKENRAAQWKRYLKRYPEKVAEWNARRRDKYRALRDYRERRAAA